MTDDRAGSPDLTEPPESSAAFLVGLRHRPRFNLSRFRADTIYYTDDVVRSWAAVLEKPPAEREPADLRILDGAGRHVQFFSQLDKSQRAELYRYCSLVELKTGEVRSLGRAAALHGQPLIGPATPLAPRRAAPRRRSCSTRATSARSSTSSCGARWTCSCACRRPCA